MRTITIAILLCVASASYGQHQSRHTHTKSPKTEYKTKNKQVIAVWLNDEAIVKSGVYSDSADIDFPHNVTCKQGKHFVRWERTNSSHLNHLTDSVEKIAYKAVFADNAYHNYTINHYKEKIQDSIALNNIDNYELVSSETKQGRYGTMTEAETKNFNGYITPLVNQQLINENDSTVVNIYYDRETYSLTWNTNGGIVTNSFAFGAMKYGSEITIPQLKRYGYSYKWDMSIPETLTANSTFTAIWTANKYEVEWLMNNGTDSVYDVKFVDYGTDINKPEEEPFYIGHEFKGWGMTSASTVALTEFGKMTAADTLNKSFYAIWEPNTYEVLWLYNRGEDKIFQKDLVKFDSIIQPPISVPTSDGYVFTGWGLEFNSDTAITDYGKLTNVEGLKFYALWEPYDSIAPTKKSKPKQAYSQPTARENRKMLANISADFTANNFPVDISVTPNPTDGKAYYKNPYMKTGDVISIFDNNGKALKKQTVANDAIEEIDLQDLPQGIYLIELNGEQTKIIKM